MGKDLVPEVAQSSVNIKLDKCYTHLNRTLKRMHIEEMIMSHEIEWVIASPGLSPLPPSCAKEQ